MFLDYASYLDRKIENEWEDRKRYFWSSHSFSIFPVVFCPSIVLFDVLTKGQSLLFTSVFFLKRCQHKIEFLILHIAGYQLENDYLCFSLSLISACHSILLFSFPSSFLFLSILVCFLIFLMLMIWFTACQFLEAFYFLILSAITIFSSTVIFL